MAATTMRSHWAQYDDELEDSDQTISASRRARRSGGPTLPLQPLSASSSSVGRKKPPVKSAFFTETTDEEELSAHGASGFADSMRLRGAGRSAPQQLYAPRTAPPLSGNRTSQTLVSFAAGASQSPSFPLQHARLHIGEIQFPVTRSVLWDRRVLADPIGISVEQVLPRFTVVASVLKQVYQLFRDRLTSKESTGDSEVLCYLCGEAATMVAGKHVKLTKVVMKQQRKDKWDPNVLWVPVFAIMGKNKTLQLSQKQYVFALSSAQQAYSDDKIDALTAKLQPNFLVTSSAVHGTQLELQLECPAPPILFRFSLIRNLPLLMTPLAASLSRQEFGSAEITRRSGYLTLDRARKAVPVLKTDPLILQQPIVGVWVYGIPLSEEWSEATAKAQMADPYLYFACLGYISPRTIKEKAELSKNTFLVAIYPSGSTSQDGQRQVSPLPRFFECSYSEHLSPQSPTPIDLYAQQRSCLVGVSSFSADLEFKLSSSPCEEWENARQQLGIPTTPVSRDESVKQQQEESKYEHVTPSQSDLSFASADAGRSSFSRVMFAQSRTEKKGSEDAEGPRRSSGSIRNEDDSLQANNQSSFKMKENAEPNSHTQNTKSDDAKLSGSQLNQQANAASAPRLSLPNEGDLEQHDRSNSSTVVRSCCKSQALLTIQHQQILENQQRQLHEMQEQIAHLRRLLDATKKMDSGSNGEFRTSPGMETEFFQEPSESVEQKFQGVNHNLDETIDEEQGFARFDVADDEEQDEEVEADEDCGYDEDAGSSLHLSSISNSSMRSDLSSLSSSLVGKRLKEKFRKSGSGFNQFAQSRGSEADSAFMERASLHDYNGRDVAIDENQAGTRDHEHFPEPNYTEEPHDTAGEDSVDRLAYDNNDARELHLNEEQKVEESDSDEESQIQDSPLEKLLMPEQYMKKNGTFVDHHRGCFTAPTSDLHSFCVPRIKFTSETSSGYPSDSEDEEIRLIEQKYKRLLIS